MEMRMFIGVIALMLAFASLFAGSHVFFVALRRRRAAMAAQGDRFSLVGLVSWRLRNGFSFMAPAVQVLLKIKHVRAFADEAVVACASRGYMATRESVLSVFLMSVGVLAIIIGVVLGNIIGAIACSICLVVVGSTYVANEGDKRNEEIREAIPGALETMGACFGAGFTLLQTFAEVAREAPGPLGDMFARCAHILETGGSVEEALTELRTGAYASELAFVAVALDVQHQSGGTIRRVLQAAAESVKGMLSLRRSLRVQTAQARLSARIVAVMPFVLVAVFTLVSPDFLAPFFSSALGFALFGAAIFMQFAGVMLVRRALSVDGVA